VAGERSEPSSAKTSAALLSSSRPTVLVTIASPSDRRWSRRSVRSTRWMACEYACSSGFIGHHLPFRVASVCGRFRVLRGVVAADAGKQKGHGPCSGSAASKSVAWYRLILSVVLLEAG